MPLRNRSGSRTSSPLLPGACRARSVVAYRQWGPYELMMIFHVISGEVLLILIPFTKLGHMVLFFFTRAFIGFEMGARRNAPSW